MGLTDAHNDVDYDETVTLLRSYLAKMAVEVRLRGSLCDNAVMDVRVDA